MPVHALGVDEIFQRNLVKNGFLIKYLIDKDKVEEILDELKILGISNSMIFPDFEGIAKELDTLKFKKG